MFDLNKSIQQPECCETPFIYAQPHPKNSKFRRNPALTLTSIFPAHSHKPVDPREFKKNWKFWPGANACPIAHMILSDEYEIELCATVLKYNCIEDCDIYRHFMLHLQYLMK